MKKTGAFGAALALALVLAGCGTQNQNNSSTTSGKGQGEQSIVIASNATYPPFEYAENGKIVGFDIDMIKEIAQAEHLKVQIKSVSFDGIIPALQAGSVDAAVAGMTIKKDRLQNVNFSNAYYRSGVSILTKKNSPIHSLQDLKGHVVATETGTSSVDVLKKAGITNIKQFSVTQDAYNALESGGADAVVFDNPSNVLFAKSHNDVHIVGGLLTGEYYGIAVTKKNPELLKELNDGLKKIQQNGEYEKLFDKYFNGDKRGMIKGVVNPNSVAVN
ncbi:MAG: basic amino acid ABC transporter substrate-binding protein [Alicyclobacillus herbarius]|uniref:basic amino acid ABC transporter substrate-binding protein n=1 Tax=Alicyclobacillus herbarius TaxID=122960 RepID=UPI000413047C|nr:basic amino acid ABC transporter substrate-binding protein [Alicyclobacillus herbarius]MCL6631479.1 basic amino acid ABC transporter substrate-binding protein [Alicyclobacillus herbarius]